MKLYITGMLMCICRPKELTIPKFEGVQRHVTWRLKKKTCAHLHRGWFDEKGRIGLLEGS